MAKKKSFILYADLLGIVEKLPPDKAGELFLLILQHVNGKAPNVDDLLLQIAFQPIKNQLERDFESWEDTCSKRSKAGKASADKRQHMSTHVESVKHKSTNSTDNVNDTVTVNVTETATDIVTVNENDIVIPHPLQQFVKNLKEVSRIKTQLTHANCEALLRDHGEEMVKEILLAMENTKGITNKYTSVYLTVNAWAHRRKSDIRITDPGATQIKRTVKPITHDQL